MIVFVSVFITAVTAMAWTPLIRHPKNRGLATIGFLLIGGALLGVLLLQPRWMIVPLATATTMAVATIALRSRGQRTRRARTRLRTIAAAFTSAGALGAAIVAGGAGWALPMLKLPTPSGPYAVGTTVIQWDTGADESLTSLVGDSRVLVAQLWYPTQASGPRQAYIESSIISDAVASEAGLPGFLLDGVSRASTNAVANAPRTDGKFPLVLFSPGLGGVRTQNTAWAEDLASNGYIVAAVDHPYDSAAVLLKDGTVIRSTLSTTGDDATDQEIADDLASIRADDLIATLDHLEEDLAPAKVVTAGHSIGGAAAILAASRDARVDAVINLDGLPRGGLPTVPILAFVAGEGTGSEQSDARYEKELAEVLHTCGTRIVLPGAQHLSLTDAALFLPPIPSLIGSEGRTTALRAVNKETRAFLNSALNNRGEHCS